MLAITGRGVNELYRDALWMMRISGLQEESRNGKVQALPEPFCATYQRPWERVLFHPERDANPYFHLMESLWMLAGAEDVAFLAQYNSNIARYSDDGVIFHGAYGHRWRYHFEKDQLIEIIAMLRADPTTRRAVLAMWDPMRDLGTQSLDLPCNLLCMFRVVRDTLTMTITNRSNDLVWGAFGANAVHFSILHELIARAVGIPQGQMYQFTNNLHIYEQHWPMMESPYALEDYPPTIPLLHGRETWQDFVEDCEELVSGERQFITQFFNSVVQPARFSYDLYKTKMLGEYNGLSEMPYCDWKVAMEAWLERRNKQLTIPGV